MINQAIHTLDLLQWLIGEVTTVSGQLGTRALAGTIEVEDAAALVLDHARGPRSIFFTTVARVIDSPLANRSPWRCSPSGRSSSSAVI